MKSIKKLLVAVLTLAMLCGLTLSTFSVSAAVTLTDNLLIDPGFEVPTEDDLYDYWGPYDAALVELIEDPSQAHEGNKFVKISERSSSHDCPTQDITSVVKEYGAGRYYISCWVKFEKNQDILPDGYPMNFNMTIEVQCSDMNWGFSGKMWYSLFPEGPNGMNDVDEWPAVDSEDTWVKVGGYVDLGWSKTLVNAKWRVFSRTVHTESHDMNEAYTFVMDDCELRKEVEATGTTTNTTTKPTTAGSTTAGTTTSTTAGTSTGTTTGAADNDTTDSTTSNDTTDSTTVADDNTTTTTGTVDDNVDDGADDTTGEDANTNTDTDGGDKGNDSTWLIIIIVAAAVIIVGGVLIFLLSKKKTDTPAE